MNFLNDGQEGRYFVNQIPGVQYLSESAWGETGLVRKIRQFVLKLKT